MINFEPESVYTVDGDGCLDIVGKRQRLILPLPASAPNTIDHAQSTTILVDGIKPGDFAIFATLRDDESVKQGVPFLVTGHCNSEQGAIVAADLIEQAPTIYMTKHLARVLQYILPNELEQFNIPAIGDAANRLFPTR